MKLKVLLISICAVVGFAFSTACTFYSMPRVADSNSEIAWFNKESGFLITTQSIVVCRSDGETISCVTAQP